MWIHRAVCGAAVGDFVMENTWVMLRLKQVLVMVRLSCAWVLCSLGNLGLVLVSSALAEPCCLGSILLCSGPMELVARLEEGCRSPGTEQSREVLLLCAGTWHH